jgi:hypothetical protein
MASRHGDDDWPEWINSTMFRIITYILIIVQIGLMVACTIFVIWLSSKIDIILYP